MSVRRASFLFPLQTLAAASAITPSSPPIRPPRRPRTSCMPLTLPPPPTFPSNYSRALSCPSHHPAFASASGSAPRFAPASLCMVCHPVAPSDDPASPSPRTANRVFLSHAPPSPAPTSDPMSPSTTSIPSTATAKFEPQSNTSKTPQIQTTAFETDGTTPPSQSHIQSAPPASTPNSSVDDSNNTTGDTVAESDANADADTEADADTALSTSTVTSVDSSDMCTSDSRDRQDVRAAHLTFRTGVAFFPHPDKREKGGEDAFFMQDHALGVFDGVGGWSSIGVDAGLYSKELARLTSLHIERDGPSSAVEALKSASLNNRAIGSSTACVVGLEGNRLIGVNLGDSGLVIIRRGDVVYRTNEQQHYFNCPFQVGTNSMDTIEVGAPIDVMLQHGDCIIMGTDGLWDNVFPEDVVDIVVSHGVATANPSTSAAPSLPSSVPSSPRSGDGDAKELLVGDGAVPDSTSMLSECVQNQTDFTTKNAHTIAQELAELAIKVANDDRAYSPFSVNAQNAGHLFLGGKGDDITILAALVVDPSLGADYSSKNTQTISQDLAEVSITVTNDDKGASPFS